MSAPEAAKLKGIHVLIVEDHRDSAEMLSEFLQHHGATTRTTGQADAAVELVKSLRPHIVLVDLRLAGTHDGRWVLDRIRELPRPLGAIPVIATTGDRVASPQMQEFSGVLVKPIDLDRLVDLLHRAAGR